MEQVIQERVQTRGGIEVICGSMFSGKTEELIRRIKRAQFAKQKIVMFKPTIDVRYSVNDVVSHDKKSFASIPVVRAKDMLEFTDGVDVVGIDEAQFFDDEIVEIAQILANNGIRVIIAGLDMDYLGKPFGPMPALLSVADDIYKVHAICVRCGNLAYVSHRLVASEKQVLLGEVDAYEPLCRSCFNKIKNRERKESEMNLD